MVSMSIDRHAVTAQDCVPALVAALYPEVVPVHAISIVDVLNAEGKRELIVLTDSDQPPWVTSGLLECIKSDVQSDWSGTAYPYIDEDEDEDEDDEDYEDEDD